MKILIFGSGNYYQKHKKYLASNADILAIIDNNHHLYGKHIDNFPVISPYDIERFTYDKIVLMSVYAKEMKEQLLGLDIREENIWFFSQFKSEFEYGNLKFYCGNPKIREGAKNVLIITTGLHYDGGSLAAVYAAIAIQSKGYNIILAAPDGNTSFIKDTLREKINILICPALPYLHKEELFWIQQFDIVMVNVFQMILCACEISKIKPVMWWIHEPKTIYKNIMYQFSEYANSDAFSNINIFAVSRIPQNNFNYFFTQRIDKTLAYGIPDRNKFDFHASRDKTVFAVIGGVNPRKAQDIFIQAISLLGENDKKNTSFWIIGHIGFDNYGNMIRELASKDSSIQILGELTRDEISNAYKDIDVVVCSSLEDPLPIVMTECMMWGKVCVTSDANGTVDYIQDGKSGFIFKSGDSKALAKKMHWIIRNKEKLPKIGMRARKIYEKYFTLEKFGNRLESALLETMSQHKSRVN